MAKRRQCITLSTEGFFLEVQDRAPDTTVAISYRTRLGKGDLSGGGSNFVAIEQVDTARLRIPAAKPPAHAGVVQRAA